MKVILTRDVPKVGRDGEIVTVADGYARNYLFPRSLAIVAKGAAIKQHESRIAREHAKTAALLTTAQESAEKIRDKAFQIIGKASPKSTRLFGSVTEADVAQIILKNTGVDVDKRRISLIDPIKVTGHYALTARLHPEVVVPFTVDVVTQEQLDAVEKARLLAEEKAAREAAKAAEAAAAIEAARAAAEAAKNPAPVAEAEAEVTGSDLDAAPDAEG